MFQAYSATNHAKRQIQELPRTVTAVEKFDFQTLSMKFLVHQWSAGLRKSQMLSADHVFHP
jgi:hypothetical protein